MIKGNKIESNDAFELYEFYKRQFAVAVVARSLHECSNEQCENGDKLLDREIELERIFIASKFNFDDEVDAETKLNSKEEGKTKK